MPRLVNSSGFNKGFTLIELLVVVVIIAMLAAIALVSYQEFSRKGRDAKRQGDIAGMQSALQQFNSDHGYYPLPGASCTNGTFKVDCELKSANGLRTYLAKIPKDPVTTNDQYCYGVTPAGCNNTNSKCTNYNLYAKLESKPAGTSSCGSGTTYNLGVSQP